MDELEYAYEAALTKLDEAIVLETSEVESVETAVLCVERLESDMDGLDYAISIAAATVSAFVTTNQTAASWLAEVHDAASGKTGDYDLVQNVLGKLLYHQGDGIDRFASPDGDRYYVMFHRLLFGHDILSTRGASSPITRSLSWLKKKGSSASSRLCGI